MMRKRKPDTSQQGQLNLYKFFRKEVDVSSEKEESKNNVYVAVSPPKHVLGEPHSACITRKSSVCSSPTASNDLKVSPKKQHSSFFTQNSVDNSNCSDDELLPPTPKSNKFGTGMSRLHKKCKVSGSSENKSPKEKNTLQAKIHTANRTILSPVLSVVPIVNQDNVYNPKQEHLDDCKNQNQNSGISYSKENDSSEKEICCLPHVSNDCLFSSETSAEHVAHNVDVRLTNKSHSEYANKSPKSKYLDCETHEVPVNNFEDLFEDWDICQIEPNLEEKIEDLQLDSLERCKVVSIKEGPGKSEKTVVLSSTKTQQITTCLLRGVWAISSKLLPGDVINIRCNSKSDGKWVLGDNSATSISQEMEVLVEKPDALISGTSIVGSLFCPRKSALAERFKGFEQFAPPPLLLNDPCFSTDFSLAEMNVINSKVPNSARIMLIGSLVHELLQTSLQNNLCSVADIRKAAGDILYNKKTADDMYAAQVDLHDIVKEVTSFVPKISRFMRNFVITGCGSQVESGDVWGKGYDRDESAEWKGTICEIKDIEENLWVPSMGMKGKIDVTIGVKIHGRRQKGKLIKEMPLELKTGRNSYSVEHQGQVLLYCMMMSALAAKKGNDPVQSGLLLYLREESIREIKAGKYEMRDLILLRNELASFLSLPPLIMNEKGLDILSMNKGGWVDFNSSKISMKLPDLPEPINHRKACSNCPYLTLCSAHLKCNSSLDSISKNHPMSLLAPQALKHLKPSHLDYFVYWCSLITLEYMELVQESKEHYLWTMEPLEREKQGRCLSHLTVTEVKFISEKEREVSDNILIEGYVHSMTRAENFSLVLQEGSKGDSLSDKMCYSLQKSNFNVGERVLISTSSRVAISSGIVSSITAEKLCLCLNRDITTRYGKGEFHVDKYEYQSTSCAFCLCSMGLLIEDNWSATRLRELIIDRREPTFMKKLNKRLLKCSSFLKELNPSQRRAVVRAVSTKDYLLVRGLPGTGKTATIVAMVQVFMELGLSVLLTGHSHSSVDNVMLRLVNKGLGESMIRIGRTTSQIHSGLKQYTESVLTENCMTPQDLEKVYQSKMIVGVTCMGCGHPLLCTRAFDVCILDEAGQVLLPVSLRPILSAKVFILVGDPQQLPPVVRGHRARLLGLEKTLFSRLESSEACVTLDLQYRMNSVITKFANDITYESSLICANDEVANGKVDVPAIKDVLECYSEEKWLHSVISAELNASVMFIDTGKAIYFNDEAFYPQILEINSCYSKVGENICKYSNIAEAAIIYYVVKAYMLGGIDPNKIGVIAPYKDQVALLKKVLKKDELKGDRFVEINTVDQFQGRDKEIILYSFTRSESEEESRTKDFELLSDKHRLTVAITRAKFKLICIGDSKTLKTYKILNEFLSFIPQSNIVNVCDNNSGFSWQKIYSGLTL